MQPINSCTHCQVHKYNKSTNHPSPPDHYVVDGQVHKSKKSNNSNKRTYTIWPPAPNNMSGIKRVDTKPELQISTCSFSMRCVILCMGYGNMKKGP